MQSALDTTEMTVLSWSVVLLLAQVAAQAFASYDLGPRYLLGPRDENRPRNVLAGRLARALRNLLETYPAFIAVALALVVTEKAGGIAATGAWMWLAGAWAGASRGPAPHSHTPLMVRWPASWRAAFTGWL